MLHTKDRGNRSTGSGEGISLKGFYHIWVWQPSWSCGPDAANTFVPPTHGGSKNGFNWPSGFWRRCLSIVDDGRIPDRSSSPMTLRLGLAKKIMNVSDLVSLPRQRQIHDWLLLHISFYSCNMSFDWFFSYYYYFRKWPYRLNQILGRYLFRN